ncbi:MTOR-associated protein MEAK7 isoform X2 [Stegostoma tigrinum]|uniref:MTOR-associated protein MEAK7 isoform X2 n=1 Tax=Stegostoma tigrinum TaxID=3053191 RepID=UPI00286FF017|nr:MTOR-associated protein MEAK7 isoform X2 [Stegostoma tigrinum]
MGNGESHGLNRIWRCPFSAEERVILDNVFDSMSGSKSNAKDRKDAQKQITLAMLKAYVHVTVQGPMTIRLYNAMRSIDPIKNTEGLSYSFTKDLITTVIQLLHIEQMLGGWTLEKTADPTLGTVRLTNTLMSQLKAKGRQKLTTDNLLSEEYGQHELKDWMYTVSLISTFLRMFVAMSLHITSAKSQGEVFSTGHLLPECTGIKYTGVITVFDVPSVIYLNACLPSEHQHKWQLLFSSHFHGSSFTRFCSRILHKGPTLLVVKDADGYIFGGYASHSWDARPQFQGDSKCFLFTLCPQFGIYTCTGYNDHYMYLNHGQQTMPNGLGMGGQLYYFGLWIDSNYGEGHSKAKTKCTTYDSPQLSAQEHFKIDTLEVWSVGNPPDDQLARSKSVLDSEPEAQALLHMIGKVRMSDGLRDPNEDKGNK